MTQGRVTIGMVPSSAVAPGGICVAECQYRRPKGTGRKDPTPESHFLIRLLESVPARTPAPVWVARLREIVDGLRAFDQDGPKIFVDITGVGYSLVGVLSLRLPSCTPLPAYFNHGDKLTIGSGAFQVGKAHLVSRLKLVLEFGRLHLPPRQPEFEKLASELVSFSHEIESDASSREGAFKVGSRDELVTALGLAVLWDGSF